MAYFVSSIRILKGFFSAMGGFGRGSGAAAVEVVGSPPSKRCDQGKQGMRVGEQDS